MMYTKTYYNFSRKPLNMTFHINHVESKQIPNSLFKNFIVSSLG